MGRVAYNGPLSCRSLPPDELLYRDPLGSKPPHRNRGREAVRQVASDHRGRPLVVRRCDLGECLGGSVGVGRGGVAADHQEHLAVRVVDLRPAMTFDRPPAAMRGVRDVVPVLLVVRSDRQVSKVAVKAQFLVLDVFQNFLRAKAKIVSLNELGANARCSTASE